MSCVVKTEEHTHQYSDWKTDAEKHWKKCTCGKIDQESPHVSGEPATTSAPEVCIVCAYEISPQLQRVPSAGSLGGWEEILNGLEGASGDLEVDMNGATTVPQNLLDKLSGKDTTATFRLDNGVEWSVNGRDIPTGIGDLNLGVSVGGSTIPVDVVNAVAGSKSTVQLELDHNGSFGTALQLSVPLGSENAGKMGNMYYFNPVTCRLEYRGISRISAAGDASWPFDHASSYVVVISDECLEAHQLDNAFDANCNLCGAENEGRAVSIAVTVVSGAVILAGAGFGVYWFVFKKKKA